MTEPQAADWGLVGKKMTERLYELGWTQADLVRRSGISDTQLRKFLTGAVTGTPRPATIRKIEIALDWPAGAVTQILEDGEITWPDPTPRIVHLRTEDGGAFDVVLSLDGSVVDIDKALKVLGLSELPEASQDQARAAIASLLAELRAQSPGPQGDR